MSPGGHWGGDKSLLLGTIALRGQSFLATLIGLPFMSHAKQVLRAQESLGQSLSNVNTSVLLRVPVASSSSPGRIL